MGKSKKQTLVAIEGGVVGGGSPEQAESDRHGRNVGGQ